jgi:hypothetical protein
MLLFISSHNNYSTASVIVTPSGDGAQRAGENFILTCQDTEEETPSDSYRWFRNDMIVDDQTSDALSFSPLNQRQDNGSYFCEVTSNFTTMNSSSVVITVVGMLLEYLVSMSSI